MTPNEIEGLKLALEALKLAIEGAAGSGMLLLGIIGWFLADRLKTVTTTILEIGKRLDGHEARLVRIETMMKIDASHHEIR